MNEIWNGALTAGATVVEGINSFSDTVLGQRRRHELEEKQATNELSRIARTNGAATDPRTEFEDTNNREISAIQGRNHERLREILGNAKSQLTKRNNQTSRSQEEARDAATGVLFAAGATLLLIVLGPRAN